MSTSEAAFALEAFRRISSRWKLSDNQQATLLGIPLNTMYRWYRKPESAKPDRDKLERISYIVGLLGGLAKVYGNNDNADAWLHRSNDDFGGRAPLERMLDGNVGDLAEVRAYVDRFANLIW